jgi:hypothetical protein
MRAGRHTSLIGFAASFLAVGIPYWLVPSRDVNLPSTLVTPALAVVAASAGILRGVGAARFRRIVWIVAASVPAAVMARVQVETLQDPTAHNLWPFEIVIALGVGLACAVAGALAGSVYALRAARRSTGGAS